MTAPCCSSAPSAARALPSTARAATFADKGEYTRARSEYFSKAYSALMAEFYKDVEEIIKRMNAALPEDVRT